MLQFGRLKKSLIYALCGLGVLLALPNLFSADQVAKWPGFLPQKQINLGLDLQGGSYLLLSVKSSVVIEEHMQDIMAQLRQELREQKIAYRNLRASKDAVSFALPDAAVETDAIRGVVRSIEHGLDVEREESLVTITMSDSMITELQQRAVDQSIEIVRRRIDETGTNEPIIQRQGDDRILVQLPGEQNPDRIKTLLGKTAKLSFHLVRETLTKQQRQIYRPKPGEIIVPGEESRSNGQAMYFSLDRAAIITGEMLVDSRSAYDQTQRPVVNFRFNTRGAKKFAEVTQQNVGKPFAIVLDGTVLTAPKINEPILGGSGMISGNFTAETSEDLALLLRSGALPAPLEVLEERTVGPGLGADSIAAGKMAGVVGLAGIIVFMLLVYGRFGAFATAALVVNIAMLLGVLSFLQATLTLPGIAGIVLTMGMAVDANVLVFERIREEVRNGLAAVRAIETGYKHALSSVVDANLTTFIATLILFLLGSGPVKGFAVTLAIGVITSMFTALIFTRLLVAEWYRLRRPAKLPL